VLPGKEKHTLNSGQKAVAPKNTLPCFKNPTGQKTTFQVEMRPGQPGFEKAIMAGYGMESDGRDPFYHPYQPAVMLERSEIRMGGAMWLLDPAFRLCWRGVPVAKASTKDGSRVLRARGVGVSFRRPGSVSAGTRRACGHPGAFFVPGWNRPSKIRSLTGKETVR
jgi:hypothetical protein